MCRDLSLHGIDAEDVIALIVEGRAREVDEPNVVDAAVETQLAERIGAQAFDAALNIFLTQTPEFGNALMIGVDCFPSAELGQVGGLG